MVVFWPAAGFSAATLIVLGRNARWPVAVGVMAALIAFHLTNDRLTLLSVVFALCGTGNPCSLHG